MLWPKVRLGSGNEIRGGTSCEEKGGPSENREAGRVGLQRFPMPTPLSLAKPGSDRVGLRSWAVELNAHDILLPSVLSCRSWNNHSKSLGGGGLRPSADLLPFKPTRLVSLAS